MKTTVEIGMKLRAVERDIAWHKHVYANSKDQVQRDRVQRRLTDLTAQRAALQMHLQGRGA